MKKITIKDLSPVAQEIIVTGKIGDLSVRQYVKAHNLVDEIVKMRIKGFNDDDVVEVIEGYLPEGLDADTALKRAKEIVAVTKDEVEALVDENDEKLADYEDEANFMRGQMQRGEF